MSEGVISGFAEALDEVLRHARTLASPRTEKLPLLDCAGRVLGGAVAADRDQPPFHRATRDGFAVTSRNWNTGQKLRVAGQVRAGAVWRGGDIGPEAAVEIMTGAPVPHGTDSVAMVEHAVQLGSFVWVAPGRKLEPGENVVFRGSEAREGEVLLRSGSLLGAAEIAVAATCGREELEVRRRPVVAIVATGDELVSVSQEPEEHQIRNSNGYALAAMVQTAGAAPRQLQIARDTPEDLRARISDGSGSSLMLLSGGVSAGKYDLVEEVLAEFSAEFFFTGVRMQPGKPVVFGRLPASGGEGWTYFFGLPGNPVSTQVTFQCFVEPMLRAMCGAPAAGPRFVLATLGEDVKARAGLTRVLPALLTCDLQQPQVRLVRWQGSGDLAANARANCYAVLPEARDLKAGDVVTILLR